MSCVLLCFRSPSARTTLTHATGRDYIYTPDDPSAPQHFLPDALRDVVFLDPDILGPVSEAARRRASPHMAAQSTHGKGSPCVRAASPPAGPAPSDPTLADASAKRPRAQDP
jgi:hypothetical protein